MPETSFYPALSVLLNAVGQELSPKVRCVINLRNRGGGIPDGGLFTADQFKRRPVAESDSDPFGGLPPSRGAIEAKAPDADLIALAGSEQVGKYWKTYGLVLITNFRAFAVVGTRPDGKPAIQERFDLAATPEAFASLTAHPRKAADELGDRLIEYLRRALRHNAPLSAPQDVAALLASYARDALARVEAAAGLPALSGLRSGLEESLGMTFVGDKGEHFFRSTLVQTLFYGVFSAWVLHSRRKTSKAAEPKAFKESLRESAATYHAGSGLFDWHQSGWLLPVPMVRMLFEQVATRSKLEPLGLTETLDWTAAALNRVDRTAFFAAFDEGHAVQYFYEPFLEAFDPDLRKQLGVWYTPSEIVDYQVERVDTVLREELDIPDGLADPRVVVLDPCCGTAAYLRTVLRVIARTLREKGGDALVAQELKKAAMERVYGFEILPAPYVVAHLQLGLLLETLGAPLSETRAERAGVYLTNALTGWEPPKEKHKEQILLPELREEHDAADRVKQDKPILVILGNPPYNAFAGVSPEEENNLVEPYKAGLNTEWGIKKFNLDDLYVRFFRLAEKRIADRGGRGVVSFISNHSWISDPSFVVMRKHLLESFDRFWIENMHGNRKISEYAPDGRTSETVFAIPGFSAGIQQGVAISLWVKKGKGKVKPIIRFRDDLNAAKAIERRKQLLASLKAKKFDAQYEQSEPGPDNRYSFRPSDVSDAYLKWPRVTELSAITSFNGPIERRGNSLIVFETEQAKLQYVRDYLDALKSNEEISALVPEFMFSSGEFKPEKARALLLGKASFNESNIVKYPFKPFDTRVAYLDPNLQPLFSRPSPQLLNHRIEGNKFFITRDTADKDPEGPPFMISSMVCDYDFISGHARHFPIRLKAKPESKTQGTLVFDADSCYEAGIKANLSKMVMEYLADLGLPDPDQDKQTAELIWMHALAVGYSPAYLTEHADGIRQDWPRIPLPADKAALLASAELGRQVAALLDTETPLSGVTAGTIRPELRPVGQFARVDGGRVDPEAGDFDLTAGWGHGGKGGVTMPGKGKLVDEGAGTVAVFLNDKTCWRGIPRPVWEFTIGGYQVMKKWLSYREKELLGRGLTLDEVNYVTEMARRLAALAAMQSELDASYKKVAGSVS